MLFNSLHQIGRSTVVQEKNAFPETPERRRTEFISFCLALTYAVLECTHLVKRKIRIKIRLFTGTVSAQLRDRGITPRLKHRGMAKGAPYLTELMNLSCCIPNVRRLTHLLGRTSGHDHAKS